MTTKLADGTLVLMGQKKSDPTIKTAYIAKSGCWVLCYQGDFAGLGTWLKHQRKLAEKRSFRAVIADICGTSYRAAMEDMGRSAS